MLSQLEAYYRSLLLFPISMFLFVVTRSGSPRAHSIERKMGEKETGSKKNSVEIDKTVSDRMRA